jgi:uncharacterized cupredoxin-like copper-binding protein
MKLTCSILAAALALACSATPAHEGNAHGQAARVAKEQKPWGIAGDAKRATRTIAIVMTDDMRFSPDRIEVKQGETIRFAIRNSGKLLHEMVIGTRKELDEHAALMVRFPRMEHEDASMAHVAAGKAGKLVWNFNRAGEFDFACLVAGHYQAGMVGKIKVVAAAREDVHVPSHPQVAHAAPAADMTQAEVRKVDKRRKKITLTHGEIKNLDMPPMTMVFQLKDASALDKFKAGDKVRFRASNEGGQLTVTEIHTAE